MPLQRLRSAARIGHLRQTDEMLAMAVDERGYRRDPHNIDTSPHQGKAFSAEIDDGRRESELAVEPGFDRVVVGRRYVDWLRRHQGSNMRRYNFRGHVIAGPIV